MDSKLSEFFSYSTHKNNNWETIAKEQQCKYIKRKCVKGRKSIPDIALGTCTVRYGKEQNDIIICPHRLLQDSKIFMDSIHLLTLHEPGNELHVVPEISIPGGSVDYIIASVKRGVVKDFVGIELQTMDTTGTVWNERQKFLHSQNITVSKEDLIKKNFGINWKMTAKTILVQLHHKIETFEVIGKHLVLVSQDCLLSYMKSAFEFEHIENAMLGNSMHFHSYGITSESDNSFSLELLERLSTNSVGISKCLGLKAESSVDLEDLLKKIQSKISKSTLLTI